MVRLEHTIIRLDSPRGQETLVIVVEEKRSKHAVDKMAYVLTCLDDYDGERKSKGLGGMGKIFPARGE